MLSPSSFVDGTVGHMILITGIAGLLGRFAGRALNSALGWATVLLFGKVAQSRQILLPLVTLGSLAWGRDQVTVTAARAGRDAPEATHAWPEWAAAAIGFGLIAADMALLALGRFVPPDRLRKAPRGVRRPSLLMRRGG